MYSVPTGPTIPVAAATIKEDVVRQTNPRSAFWSAGVIQQFNGVKTPPIPKKTVRKEATPPAAQIIKDIGSKGISLFPLTISVSPVYSAPYVRNSPYTPRIKEAAVHNAAPIKYEEIGLMNTMYNSGGPSNKPTDYNSGK